MDEPSITEREETIVIPDGMLIRIEDIVTARESRDKPDQSRFRKMEIRDQGIDSLVSSAVARNSPY